MIFIWGTTTKVRKLGYVADFCPICREIREFKLSRVGVASHIYYISFGQGKLQSHIIQCCTCGQVLKTDPMTYPSYARAPLGDADALAAETQPSIRHNYADRLVLEEKVRRSPGSLSQEQRRQLIMEPFSLLNPGVEYRFKGGNNSSTAMDKQSGIGCLGTIVGAIALLVISARFREPMQTHLLLAAAIFAGVGTLYTLIQLGIAPWRFLRTKTLPNLVRALEPLKPTEEELTAALERCKTAGMLIGKKVTFKKLQAELQKRMLPQY